MLRSFLLLLLSLTCALAQDVRITEFLPVNTTGLQDEDGTPQGWIEVWNPNAAAKVPLTNWALIHEGTTWTFPAGFEIPPGEFVVVFASGKDRKVITQQLHTNFTLKAAGGGPLQLRRADTSIASTFATYPALAANVSYGRDLADNAQVGSYSTPTPEESNNYTGAGVAGKVLFSEPSRAFTGTLSVTLTEATPAVGATIRYTTNGTAPISSSLAYAGTPLVVNATSRLRARVFQTGRLPGEIETNGYLLLDGTTSGFNTAAPIVVVSNFGAGTFPDTGDQPSFMWVWEPGTDGRARLSSLPTLASRTVVDRRGSSTLGNPKTNFNLEARKGRDEDDRDVDLLGMPQGSDWVFHAPYNFDRSLLHNPFIYTLSNIINRTAMRSKMAEVFVKTNTGALSFTGAASGDYFGVYNVMEKIRRGNDRVEATKLGMYDNDAIGKTGGYITKIDRRDAGDTGFDAGGLTIGTLGLCYYYPKEVDMKIPQRDPQEQYLTQYYNSTKAALDSANFKDPVTGYAAWIDVPAAIDHHLLNVWAFNVDAFRLSGFMTKERNEKLVFGPIWDFDRALSSTDGRDANPATWRSTVPDLGTDFFNFTWWNRLFNDPDFYQKYIDRWVELRKGAFSPAAVNALLDTLNAEITTEGANRDLTRWGQAKRAWTSPFTGTNFPASQAAEIQRIKDWLQQRANFFDSQWVAPVTLNHTGGTVTPGFEVTMTAAAGSTIYYTLDGSDPRPSGGAAPSAPNVFTYTAPIVVNSLTRIKARAYNAAWTALIGTNNPPLVSTWSGLSDARYNTDPPATPATLAVTELNYHPADPTTAELAIDPALDTSDFEFIELKNVGATPIDLAGVELLTAAEFTINNDIAFTLPPGGFVILAANPAAFAIRYPDVPNVLGPFQGDLSNSGELILIEALDGADIASFTYDDAWHPASDGDGPTMETKSLTPTNYHLAATWKASLRNGGTPGYDYELTITQQPVGTVVNPQQPINLQVQATGSPSPTFQWRKNGTPIDGATSSNFSVASAAEADQGTYDVIVSNIGGNLPSSPVGVSVNDPVVIFDHPSPQTVIPETLVSFSVVATGTELLTYQWRKDNQPIDGETSETLTFVATEGHEGVYDVVVSNVVGPVTSNPAALTVQDPIMITDSPDTQTVNPGVPVTFTVTATGSNPTYQWRKGGQPIGGANAASYVISPSAEGDEGTYDVVVSNTFSSATSEPATLTVNDVIVITLQPLPQGVAPGGSATFSVAAAGTGPLTYQWRRNGTPIDGATGTSYEVTSVTEIGNYDVVVSNIVGSVTSNTVALSFVDWTAVAGSYQGLLEGPDLQDPLADPYPGRVTATVSKTGKATGKLEYLGMSYRFSFKFDASLKGISLPIKRGALQVPVTLAAHLDSINKVLELTVSHQGSPDPQADGLAPQIPKRPKTAPAARAGRYTLLLAPGTGAPTNLTAPGFLTVNVGKTGSTTWVGKLPDLTAVRGSASLTTDDRLAIFSLLYPRKFPLAGYFGGPMEVGATAVTGDFVWRKPNQNGKGKFWPGGVDLLLSGDGKPYIAPARNVRVMPETLSLQLDGPVPTGTFKRTLTLSEQNKFIFAPPNAEKVKLTLNRTTGGITGSYFDSTIPATRKLEGVILQGEDRAGGFFPGTSEVGQWDLAVPVPAP
jgi:hypothetical protein